MRFFTLMFFFALTALLLVTLAPPVQAAESPPTPASSIPSDWGIPAGLGGLGAAVVWSARMLAKTMETTSQRSDGQITKLCEVAHEAIDETRQSREDFKDGLKAFEAAAREPRSIDRHRPGPGRNSRLEADSP
jgi:hypothetical protein